MCSVLWLSRPHGHRGEGICCCCCCVPQPNAQWVSRYMQSSIDNFYSIGWKDCACNSFQYPATSARSHAQTFGELNNYLRFWRVKFVQQGAYHGWRQSLRGLTVQRTVTFNVVLVFLLVSVSCDTRPSLPDILRIYVPSRQLRSSSLSNPFCRNKVIWPTLLCIQGPTVLNKLPDNTRHASFINLFKYAPKTELFLQQNVPYFSFKKWG